MTLTCREIISSLAASATGNTKIDILLCTNYVFIHIAFTSQSPRSLSRQISDGLRSETDARSDAVHHPRLSTSAQIFTELFESGCRRIASGTNAAFGYHIRQRATVDDLFVPSKDDRQLINFINQLEFLISIDYYFRLRPQERWRCLLTSLPRPSVSASVIRLDRFISLLQARPNRSSIHFPGEFLCRFRTIFV